MTISIILPVYNPSEGWERIVISKTHELQSYYPDMMFDVILVSDGSDNTAFATGKNKLSQTLSNDEGLKNPVRLIEYMPNKGKGEAIRTGVRAASGDLMIYTDIDFPYAIKSISEIIHILVNNEADIVIGVKDESYYQRVPPMRRLISRFLRMMIRLFFRMPTDDTQCGLKGFNQKAKPVFLQTTIKRYLFDLEFVFLASRNHSLTVKTLQVQLCEGVIFRKMNFGILRNELTNFLKVFLKAIFA